MPLALTCDCGARFDADDLLAGQEIPCPECGEPIQAPSKPTPPRTSLWAVAALVLALIGAFTPAGGLLALLAGLYALNVIRQRPGQLTGQGMALTASALGLLCSIVTAVLFLRPDLVPVGSWFRQRALAGQIDTTGALEMGSRSGDVLITRPSRDWGRARRDRTDDPVVGELQQKADLLLVNIKINAYVEVIRDTTNTVALDRYTEAMRTDMNPYREKMLSDEGSGFGRRNPNWVGGAAPDAGEFPPQFVSARTLEPLDEHEGREWVGTLPRPGQKWRFIIRAYKKRGSPIHVIRAYTPAARFKSNESELRQILDTVRIPE
jgi:hypothetical protein